jgi:hypothetical protein
MRPASANIGRRYGPQRSHANDTELGSWDKGQNDPQFRRRQANHPFDIDEEAFALPDGVQDFTAQFREKAPMVPLPVVSF